MTYYLTKIVPGTYEEAITAVIAALKDEGFGVLTEIDVQATLKKKLDVDVPRYMILGACNPQLAHKALQAENKVGVLLPCNVVVQERTDGSIEVSAMDPAAAMEAIGNPQLTEIASDVRSRLNRVLAKLP
jgi:uncharacterized protein (DUF302 family)